MRCYLSDIYATSVQQLRTGTPCGDCSVGFRVTVGARVGDGPAVSPLHPALMDRT